MVNERGTLLNGQCYRNTRTWNLGEDTRTWTLGEGHYVMDTGKGALGHG